MNRTRVLIVEESPAVRRFLAGLLSGDTTLQVASAANGRIALARLPMFNPDVVLLEQEMAEMSGPETMASLRRSHPRLPVLMLGRCRVGTAPELQALALGASDSLALPDSQSVLEESSDWLRQQLVSRIKQLTGTARPESPSRLSFETRLSSRIEVVAIGASTGGPNALAALLASFAPAFPVPILVVQHMPPGFTRQLAERLDHRTPFAVREGAAREKLEAEQVWIAPGDHHLAVAHHGNAVELLVHQGPPENSCRPSADVLFRSLAEVYGSAVLAVVLTGMGQDGLRGCEKVREAGGQVLVQDEATSVVWGMPGHVARAGLAHEVLPLEQLGAEITRRVRRGRTPSSLDIRSSLVSP